MAFTTNFIPLSPHTLSTGGSTHRRIRSSHSVHAPPPANTVVASCARSPNLVFNLQTYPSHRIPRVLHLAREQRDLALAQSLHAAIVKAHGDRENTRLFNSLISTYLKLGQLSDALKVLDEMSSPDVASFTSIISYYAKSGMESETLALFNHMRCLDMDIVPNEFSFVAIVTNCIRQCNLRLGCQVHGLALKAHYTTCVHVSNALMGMYVKCQRVDNAVQVFGEMPVRDVSSWNAVIMGMVEDCRYVEAFGLFDDMGSNGTFGDRFSLSILLSAATNCFSGAEGETVHAYAIKLGLDTDLSVGNALLGFYTRFGIMEDLLSIFARMPQRDVISWTGMLGGFMEFGLVESAVDFFNQMPEKNHISYNVLLAGFCKNGQGSKGLDFFHNLLVDGVEISDFTLTSLLKACALASDRKKSEQVHGFLIKSGCKFGVWIDAALVDMCAKCGRMDDARKIFEQQSREETNFVTWTSLIHAYAQNGQPVEAFSLFHRLMKVENFANIDEIAFATILGVCGTLGLFKLGNQINSIAVKLGVSSEVGVSNATVSMYAKCGYLKEAVCFFDQMPEHDIVSWNTLINAYLLFRLGDKAISVWNHMESSSSLKPDAISYVLIISALSKACLLRRMHLFGGHYLTVAG